MGCLGVDNPPADRLWNIGSLLQTLCYFILLAYKRAEDEYQLSHMSFYDTLTSFYNRNRFIQDLQSLEHMNVSAGIVYLDVNGLKEVNDKYGHAVGDKLLVRTAGKIRSIYKASDLYRIVGDDKCKAAIGTEWTADTGSINQVVADADAKIYEDKKEFYRNNQAGRYHHHGDEVLQLADPLVLQEEISRQQFVVYLQPKISSPDRTAVGAETLIRYQSRDGSLVLPGNFLPLLEEAKSISMIDFYVLSLYVHRSKYGQKKEKGIPGIRELFPIFSGGAFLY